jgi:hypothetical protein
MNTLWGWAAVFMVCCAPARSDDSFQNKISRACTTEQGCRALAQETEYRAQRCRTQSECTQARSDLAAANARLSAHVRERESEDARAQAERSAQAKKTQERLEREQADYAAMRQQQRDERERSKQDANDREAAHMRFLGPEGRRRDLVACYEQNGPIGCADTVAKLLAATSDERERRSLIALNEKTLQRLFDTAREPIAGQILCCDGTISETCVRGAKLKNCCKSRGGVCGCKPAPAPSVQATAR